MWSTLSRTDLETVKRQLMSCREQMLRRHAEEREALNIDTAELEALDQLIGAFTEKFKPATIGIPERATTGQSRVSDSLNPFRARSSVPPPAFSAFLSKLGVAPCFAMR